MRLGISKKLAANSAEEWAAKYEALGLKAVNFPLKVDAPDKEIDEYVRACANHDLVIAEVGAWKNVMDPDPATRAENIKYCKARLQLAEYVGARCAVNITGSASSEKWDAPHRGNYDPDFQKRMIETIQEIIDAVNPKRTFYTVEPMPWMVPDSPESYLELMKQVDRPGFAVHMDAVNMMSSPKTLLFCREFLDHAFALLGPYIKSCHIKDVALEQKLTVRMPETPCGTGKFELKYYMQLADRLSPDMPVIIEHLADEEDYLAAVKYLQPLIAELEA